MAYGLIIMGKPVKYQDGNFANPEGGRFWLGYRDGWDTPTHFSTYDYVPGDVRTWPTEAEAEAYARALDTNKFWGLWWCVPSGEFEVVRITPKMKPVIVGYAAHKLG